MTTFFIILENWNQAKNLLRDILYQKKKTPHIMVGWVVSEITLDLRKDLIIIYVQHVVEGYNAGEFAKRENLGFDF